MEKNGNEHNCALEAHRFLFDFPIANATPIIVLTMLEIPNRTELIDHAEYPQLDGRWPLANSAGTHPRERHIDVCAPS